MIPTNLLPVYSSVVLHMLFSYPSCNINLILKFYVGLKYIRAVTSAVLQKMRQQGENLMMKIQMGWSLVRGRGGLEPCLPWGKANIQGAQSLGMADTPLHSRGCIILEHLFIRTHLADCFWHVMQNMLLLSKHQLCGFKKALK